MVEVVDGISEGPHERVSEEHQGTASAGLWRLQNHGMPGAIGANLAATPTPEQQAKLRVLGQEIGVETDVLWRTCILLHAMPPGMRTFIRTCSEADYERLVAIGRSRNGCGSSAAIASPAAVVKAGRAPAAA